MSFFIPNIHEHWNSGLDNPATIQYSIICICMRTCTVLYTIGPTPHNGIECQQPPLSTMNPSLLVSNRTHTHVYVYVVSGIQRVNEWLRPISSRSFGSAWNYDKIHHSWPQVALRCSAWQQLCYSGGSKTILPWNRCPFILSLFLLPFTV